MEITREGISRYIEDYGVEEALRGFSELVDKRVYFKISNRGIERKELNMAFPAVAFLSDKEKICQALHESIDPVERQHIVKIGRLSNLTVDKLKDKFTKLIIKEFKEHALSYGKELLLRDENEFYKTLSEIILMDSMRNMKALMLLAFKKLKRYDDEFIYLLISYIVKARADYSHYERVQAELGLTEGNCSDDIHCDYKKSIEISTAKLKAIISTSDKKSIEFLEIASYLKLLSETIDDENKDRYSVFLNVLKDKLEKLVESSVGFRRELTEIEREILAVIF